MSRKQKPVPVHLNPGNFSSLPDEDLHAILRAADDLIAQGGRTMLTKILKGSREKRLLEHGHDACPAYGHFAHLKLEEIQERVDWVIDRGYLGLFYDGKLPLLEFTEKGWAIEAEQRAEELLEEFQIMLITRKAPYDMTYLRDRNRQMILLFLDKIQATGNPVYIPLLEAWWEIDYKKVQKRINQVIRALLEG